MTRCLVCLAPARSDIHAACSQGLFGAGTAPRLDVQLSKLHTLALAMVGTTSISGLQRKISLRLDSERNTLQVATGNGLYILKPQAQTFPNLPENEHVTMRIAQLVGLEVPSCGLVRLTDASLAYIVRRFDRTAERKRAQEDFCQLAGLSPKEKYEGSAEACFKLVDRFASEPGVEKLKLLRQFMFAWWTGNGDMHRKNLSLLTVDGRHALSPVYDLLCTRLVIADDQLAMPLAGKRDNLGPTAWSKIAAYAGIPDKALARLAQTFARALDRAVALVEHSFLPEDMKQVYVDLLRARVATFTG